MAIAIGGLGLLTLSNWEHKFRDVGKHKCEMIIMLMIATRPALLHT